MLKKTGYLLLFLLAILLIKDRPRSPAEFFHIQKARAFRLSSSGWYSLRAALFFPALNASDVYVEEVRFHRQEHALSCEVASLKMILGYYGMNISEQDLLAKLPVDDPDPRRPGNVWGDPEKGFVGSVDGAIPNSGYGVYEEPIAKLASQYRNAKALLNASLSDIVLAIAQKHPVIVWVHLSDGHDISWTTPEGQRIPAVYGEHARVLVGFGGKAESPDRLFFMDPVYGKIAVSTGEFLKDWGALDNRAVIIE